MGHAFTGFPGTVCAGCWDGVLVRKKRQPIISRDLSAGCGPLFSMFLFIFIFFYFTTCWILFAWIPGLYDGTGRSTGIKREFHGIYALA